MDVSGPLCDPDPGSDIGRATCPVDHGEKNPETGIAHDGRNTTTGQVHNAFSAAFRARVMTWITASSETPMIAAISPFVHPAARAR